MKRISVIGCGGSGKTTLANKLATKINVPAYHLDCISYGVNWSDIEPTIFQQHHQAWLDKPEWIIEGTMIEYLDERLNRANIVIFLDVPRWLCIYGIFKRLISEYGQTRKDMASGCVESFDWPFLKYVWNFNKQTRPKILEILDKNTKNCDIITLKSRSNAKEWIEQL